MKERREPILYIHCLSFFGALNACILKIPGIKYNPNGYNIDIPNLLKFL